MGALENVLAQADREPEIIKIRRSERRLRVFRCFIHAKDGLTCDEVERMTRLPHQTVSARMKELRDSGAIVRTGRTRLTRHKKEAHVHIIPKEARKAVRKLEKELA